MPSTRQQFCDRVLRMLNMTDGDAPASAGDIEIVNGLIEPVIARLARAGLVYTFDYGTPGTLSSGAIPDSIFYALAQVFTLAAAPDFGAPLDTYKAIADLGEQTLASLRYKADRTANPTPALAGTRGDLCQRTLKILGIIREGDIATDEAVQVVNRLINPTLTEIARRGIHYTPQTGVSTDLTSGKIPPEEILPLAQFLSRNAAAEFGPPFITGTLENYAALASEAEMKLRRMTASAPVYAPLRAQYY